MPVSTADGNHDNRISVAPFWGWLLRAVGIGKSAVGGAGVAIALLGVAEIAVAIFASRYFLTHSHVAQEYVVQVTALLGALIGGVAGCFSMLRR